MNLLKLYIGTRINNKNTENGYTRDIQSMLTFIGKSESSINEVDLIAWKNDLEGLASATIARRIGSVKRYFEFLYDNGYIPCNCAKCLKAPRICNKQETPLASFKVQALIDHGKNPRDRAIVAILASTGMRISELINIDLQDIEGNDIRILGKGNKYRIVHLNEKAMGYLNEYLKVRKSGISNLFVSDRCTPMLAKSVNNTLKCLAKRAGIECNVHNHLLRSTFATIMLDNTVPIERIQVCLGHSNVSTSLRYAKIRNEREVVRETMNIEVF